jgi:arsenate reductase
MQQINKTISTLNNAEIDKKRKVILNPLIETLKESLLSNSSVNLNFICTHNSRRSHLSQVWAQIAASYYGIRNIYCYSGGTEATKVYPSVLQALENQGLHCQQLSLNENPIYAIRYADADPPIIAFSKRYNDLFNPQQNFIALLTCNDADEQCPIVEGAKSRHVVSFQDPKIWDGKPQELKGYMEKSLEIGSEMFYIIKNLKV